MTQGTRTTVKLRERFELLALRLYVHGPEAATWKAVRPLGRSPLWLETRSLLREHGFSAAEIAHLMGIHPPGCPCWDCVVALNLAVRNRTEKLKRRKKPPPRKRRRLV